MNRQEIIEVIRERQSFLCVGLDTDIAKVPIHIRQHPHAVTEFNKAIIDATAPYCVAYKPNSAFYECLGAEGFNALEETVAYIKKNYPRHFVIVDAKRGDIGNTAKMYANAFFDRMNADAVTVAPYMGSDSVTPFTDHKNKWTILLALTSNKGSADFQTTVTEDGERLFERVIRTSMEWGTDENMMYVVGATRGTLIGDVRKIAPKHFLLVPGVGAQGGSLEDVCRYGMNADCGLLVNSSRGIIYASGDEHFAEAAAEKAADMQRQMARTLKAFAI